MKFISKHASLGAIVRVFSLLLATMCILMPAGTRAQGSSAPERKGTVIVTDRSGVRVRTYIAPADGWLVNTQIVEGATKLIISDAQLLNPYAEEVAAYATSLGKPVAPTKVLTPGKTTIDGVEFNFHEFWMLSRTTNWSHSCQSNGCCSHSTLSSLRMISRSQLRLSSTTG